MPQTVSVSSRTAISSAAASKHSSRRSVRVIMLDKHELILKIENKSARVADVFCQICQLIDLRETDYFGLALLQDNEFQFVANDTKLQKLAPKVWKSKDCSVDEPLLTFHFRVQYYVDCIGLLKEKATRLQYYLQLRDNLLHYNQSVTEEKCFLLAGLALQADYGNFDEDRHNGAYFDPREFFPAWVMIRRGQDYIANHLPSIHRDMTGMSPHDARVQYIRDLSEPPAAHNMHFYRLRRRKYDPAPGNDWLAICPKGLEVYEESLEHFKSLLSVFLWSTIGKLSCEKKKFEIVADGIAERRFIYYTSSKESGERLLDMCRAAHRFQLSRQAQLSELKKLEEHDRWGVRHHEKYIYSENADFSSLDLRRAQREVVGGQESLVLAGGGGSERRLVSSVLRRSSNAVRALSSPPSASTPVAGSEETRLQEIIIDTPPSKVTPIASLTRVTPMTDPSAFTPQSFDVSSGIEKLLANSSIRRRESQLNRLYQQQQQGSILSPYLPSTPQQHAGLLTPTSGSGFRFTEGNTGRILTEGNAGRVPVPQSILKQPSVSTHGAPADSTTLPVFVTPDARGSTLMGSTSIDAKSLQRTMPYGVDLNDLVDKLLKGTSTDVVHQNAAMPIRKSSFDGPRLGPLLPSGDVTRSTSLRQPTKTDVDDWLPVKQHNTQLNLSAMPLPVEARFQSIPFASPMKVTSNPVYSASGGTATPSSNQMTPPTYRRPQNAEQVTMSAPVQRLNHPGSIPVGRFHNDLMRPSPLATGRERPPYFDILAASDSSTSSGINSAYRCVPIVLADTAESTQVYQSNPEQSQTAGIASKCAPPSYQMAKKMNTVGLTPPGTRRYFEDIDSRFPIQITPQSNANSSAAVNSVDLTNGEAGTHRSYVATPLRMSNGRAEPLTNGPMPLHIGTSTAGYTKPVGVPDMQSAPASGNQQANVPMRQSSFASSSSNEMGQQCLQHGSGVDIVDIIKDNIGSQLAVAPMLNALCNDPSLRTNCTCNNTTEWTPPTSETPNYSTTRRLSLCQPVSWGDQPGTMVRPYSWASEQGGGKLQLSDIDVDGVSGPGPVEMVNGGDPIHSGLGFHRHSDGAVSLAAYQMHTERIMANH